MNQPHNGFRVAVKSALNLMIIAMQMQPQLKLVFVGRRNLELILINFAAELCIISTCDKKAASFLWLNRLAGCL